MTKDAERRVHLPFDTHILEMTIPNHTASPQSGHIIREYSATQVADLVALWVKAFCANRQGVNTKAYLWHIFSSGRHHAVSGDEALAQYQQHSAPEYIVLSNDRKVAFATDTRPDACPFSDYYVFPANMAWTIAFTHEAGWLGPYFARHKDFAVLNEANLSKLRKAREAELAKLKGWC